MAVPGFAWPNTTYLSARTLEINETNAKDWSYVAVSFRGLNLSGARQDLLDLILYNESCASTSTQQIPLSINGSLDGFNSKDIYNITFLINMTASQSRQVCLMWNNNSAVTFPPRVNIVWDTFNESRITTAQFYNTTTTGGTFKVENGNANLTALASGAWISDTSDNVRMASVFNFSSQFSLACEFRYRYGAIALGDYGGCVAFSNNIPTTNHTGVTQYKDNVGGGEIIRGSVAWANSAGTLITPSVANTFYNTSVWLNNTININANFSVSTAGSVYGTLGTKTERNKVGIIAAAANTGDVAEIEVKWLCAVSQNYTCVANDNTAFNQGVQQLKTFSGINILKPQNSTYFSNNVSLEGTLVSNGTIQYELNGNANVTALQYGDIFNTTFLGNVGSNTIKIFFNSTLMNGSETVSFYIFSGVKINVIDGMNGSIMNGFDINITNSTYSYKLTGQNSPIYFEYLNISNTTTFTANLSTQNYTFGTATTFINSSIFNELNLSVYRYQYFYLSNGISNFQNWTANFTNGTSSYIGSTINSVMNISLNLLPQGTVDVVTNSFGQQTNQTSITVTNSSILNTTFFVTSSTFTINFWLENLFMNQTLGNVTVTFDNQTLQQTTTNGNTTVQFLTSSLPMGNTTITMTYSGVQRKYYFFIQDNTSYLLNAFFPATSTLLTFNVQTSGGSYIQNALITLQRYINGTYRTVAQGMTGIAGQTNIYVDTTVTQFLTVSASGYNTLNQFIDFSPAQTTYTIVLSPSSAGSGFPSVNTFIDPNVQVLFRPNQTVSNTTINMSVTFTDAVSLTNWVSINITRTNFSSATSLQWFYTNLTGSSTYTQFVLLNATNQTSYYNIQLCMSRNGTISCLTKQYTVQKLNLIGSWNAPDIESSGGPSVGFWKIIFLVLVVALMAILVPLIGVPASLIMLLFAFAVATSMGIFSIGEGIIVGLIIILMIKVTT